jgi:tRNA (adenine-N(1)-)-methyltransferase non-catalytic subunit
VSAAAERQGGFGKICAGHAGKNCNSLDITRLINLSDAERESIVTAPLTELLRLRNMPEGAKQEAGKEAGGDAVMNNAATASEAAAGGETGAAEAKDGGGADKQQQQQRWGSAR